MSERSRLRHRQNIAATKRAAVPGQKIGRFPISCIDRAVFLGEDGMILRYTARYVATVEAGK
jgi:hypothetical protein